MSLARLGPLLAVALCAGCLDVTPPEGRLACAVDDDCPPGWSCHGERCFRGGLDGGLDAPGQDAPSDVPGRDAPVDGRGPDAADAPMVCGSAAECDDRDACTDDGCVGGVCRHDEIACDDDVPCTVDACSAAVGCSSVRNDAVCGAGRTCSPGATGADANGCVTAADCTDASTCGDDLFCTDDACEAGRCVHRPHVCLEDDDVCTAGFACDEASDACVPTFAPPTTVCRGVAGMCDVAETCTGTSAGCPPDRFAGSTVVCRLSAHQCDQEERCGGGPSCPPDQPAPPGTECDSSCGVEECAGFACVHGTRCAPGRVCLCDSICGLPGDDCP